MTETPQKTLSERIAWELGSWKSIELHVRYQFLERPPDPRGRPPAFDYTETRFVETSLGQKKEELSLYKDGARTSRHEKLFDGQRCLDLVFTGDDFQEIAQVRILPRFPDTAGMPGADRPVPLCHYRVGLAPLQEALARSEHLGSETYLGRPCERFYFDRTTYKIPNDKVYTLDRETGVPLKVGSYASREDYKNDLFASLWQAESLESVQGHPVVMTSTIAAYIGSDRSAVVKSRWDVLSVEFDKVYTRETFTHALPAGVPIYDSITGKVREGVPRKHQSVTPKVSQSPGKASAPIRAELPSSSFPDPSALLGGLGLALLAGGFALWWRRR